MSQASVAYKTYSRSTESLPETFAEDADFDSYDFESSSNEPHSTFRGSFDTPESRQLSQLSEGYLGDASDDPLNELDEMGLSTQSSQALDVGQTFSELESQIQKQELGEFVLDDGTRQELAQKIQDLKRRLEAGLLDAEGANYEIDELKMSVEQALAEAAADRESWPEDIAAEASDLKQKARALSADGKLSPEQADAFAARLDAIVTQVKNKTSTLVKAREALQAEMKSFNTQLKSDLAAKKSERGASIDKVIEAMDKIINEYPQDGIDFTNLESANDATETAAIVFVDFFTFGFGAIGGAFGAPLLMGDGKSFPPDRAPSVQVATAIKNALQSEGSGTTTSTGPNGQTTTVDKFNSVKEILVGLGENAYKYTQVIVSSIYEVCGRDEAETMRLLNVFPPTFRAAFSEIAISNDKFSADTNFLGDQYHLHFTAAKVAELVTESKNQKEYDHYYKDLPETAPELSAGEEAE